MLIPALDTCFRWIGLTSIALLAFGSFAPARAERMEGDLTIWVRDSAGLALSARVTLRDRVAGFTAEGHADKEGLLRFRRLPLGIFQLQIHYPSFYSHSEQISISSALPIVRQYSLQVAPIETSLTIQGNTPLFDAGQTENVFRIGRARLVENSFSTLGRSTINAVSTLPGWLLEANAVLHPRGSEYDTQYVVDGMPLYDNRSLGFIPGFHSDEFEAVHVITANIPAEFGRRLGGIIELSTRRATRPGRHTEFSLQSGSFSTTEGMFTNQHRTAHTVFSFGLHGGHTDRYLDPPSLENFTNRGNAAGLNAGLDHDLTRRDRLHLYFRSNRVNFLVPNNPEQQSYQQRQDRRGAETAGQIHYQHVFSSRVIAEMRSMIRNVGAKLWSNTFATPVFTEQNRSFLEGVISSAVTVEAEHHTIKFGSDYRTAALREHFLFRQAGIFESDGFRFDETLRTVDTGAFAQNRYRRDGLTLDVGLRIDYHRTRASEKGVSPRLGIAYYWAPADLMLRASFDRVFQTPAIENLLLSSSRVTWSLDSTEGFLSVPASRAHFYEVGVTKPISSTLRLDINHYWRNFSNYYDDDVFLNTGISFPISFSAARIEGTEISIEMPKYYRLGAYLSYSNMLGTATSPVTGGLFIQGSETGKLRDVAANFPISQDQRNTISLTIRYQLNSRTRLSVATRYGSGLPVELETDDDNRNRANSQEPKKDSRGNGFNQLIPAKILKQVNFSRGRIRPNFQVDFSLGIKIWEQGIRSADLQFDVTNATNRLNVINFTGLFSGTAIAPSRMIGLRLRTQF